MIEQIINKHDEIEMIEEDIHHATSLPSRKGLEKVNTKKGFRGFNRGWEGHLLRHTISLEEMDSYMSLYRYRRMDRGWWKPADYRGVVKLGRLR
ncbi:predicted protein [Histoplasma mississippiense (nom. inval.)]|uniref:predicted protein n=1 Tax=Ajellomyces capsulatus (strain NAm1 / WU24) TaxID=2059318 RepID=UPI000157BBF6|nr:predicted protein [Histoplasma mississippiense (nom. inval.)]EDN05747.1 predicted protein [Histoplasma mississippiense (nom. inval.)]